MSRLKVDARSSYTHKSKVSCACIGSKTGQVAATGTREGVQVYALGRPKPITNFRHESLNQHPLTISFDSSENVLACVYSDGLLKVWDITTSKTLRVYYPNDDDDILCDTIALVFHPYSTFLATLSKEGEIRIWDIRKKNFIQVYRPDTKVNAITFSPDGRWICAVGDGIRTWDLTDGNLIRHFGRADSRECLHSAFSSQELLVATCTVDNRVIFHELENFKEIESNILNFTPSILHFEENSRYFVAMDEFGRFAAIEKGDTKPRGGRIPNVDSILEFTLTSSKIVVLCASGNQMEIVRVDFDVSNASLESFTSLTQPSITTVFSTG